MDISFASFIAVKLRDLMFGINNREKNLQISLNCSDSLQAFAEFSYFIFQFSINRKYLQRLLSYWEHIWILKSDGFFLDFFKEMGIFLASYSGFIPYQFSVPYLLLL